MSVYPRVCKTRDVWRGGVALIPCFTPDCVCAGIGSFSRVRLVEVSAMKNWLATQGLQSVVESEAFANVAECSGYFALKTIRKTEVVRLKQVDHVRNESLIHSQASHPFVAQLFHRFTDDRNLNLLLEFVQGGQMHDLIQKNGRLPNETARFFAAQTVMAVQFLHSEHIVYRDLNAENVMLDRGVYVKLIDFGLAKVLNFDDPTARTWTMCGKPECLAPEIIQSKGHSREVDWWALGILIHEMLAGYPPWYDRDPFKIYTAVLQDKMKADAMPRHFDTHGRDLIKKLLTKDKAYRIGSSKNGAEDIKKHKWYRGLNWAALYNKQLVPPLEGCSFVPKLAHPLDIANFGHYPTSTEENGPTLDADRDGARDPCPCPHACAVLTWRASDAVVPHVLTWRACACAPRRAVSRCALWKLGDDQPRVGAARVTCGRQGQLRTRRVALGAIMRGGGSCMR